MLRYTYIVRIVISTVQLPNLHLNYHEMQIVHQVSVKTRKKSGVFNSQSKWFFIVHFVFCIIIEINHPYDSSLLSAYHIVCFNFHNMQWNTTPIPMLWKASQLEM